jgi:hypothetical protein
MIKFNCGDMVLYENDYYCQKCILKIVEEVFYPDHDISIKQIIHYRAEVLFIYFAQTFANLKEGLIITVDESNLTKLNLITLCQERLTFDNIIRNLVKQYDQ